MILIKAALILCPVRVPILRRRLKHLALQSQLSSASFPTSLRGWMPCAHRAWPHVPLAGDITDAFLSMIPGNINKRIRRSTTIYFRMTRGLLRVGDFMVRGVVLP